MKLIKLNFYDLEKITVCPYCGDPVQIEPHMGCCGEVHDETVWQTSDGDTYQLDEVELIYPILDVIRFEILNKWIWNSRMRRFRSHIEKVYDGSKWDVKTQSVKFSLIRRLRYFVGFADSNLDNLILSYITRRIYFTKSQRLEMKRFKKEWDKKYISQ